MFWGNRKLVTSNLKENALDLVEKATSRDTAPKAIIYPGKAEWGHFLWRQENVTL